MRPCHRAQSHFTPAYWTLGVVQEQRGDFDKSIAAFQRAIQPMPQSPLMQAALGRTFAAKRYVSPFEIASLHFAPGEDD